MDDNPYKSPNSPGTGAGWWRYQPFLTPLMALFFLMQTVMMYHSVRDNWNKPAWTAKNWEHAINLPFAAFMFVLLTSLVTYHAWGKVKEKSRA